MEISERGQLTDLLKTYLTEEDELREQIIQQGEIPEEITDRSYCSALKYIKDLSDSRRDLVEAFLDWANEVGLDSEGFRFEHNLEPDDKPKVYVRTGEKRHGNPVVREQILNDADVVEFFQTLVPQRNAISTCKHHSLDDNKDLLLQNSRLLVKERLTGGASRKEIVGSQSEEQASPRYRREEHLTFACEECVAEENRTKCDCLSFDGVVYNDRSCRWRIGLFKKIAEECEIEVQPTGNRQSHQTSFRFFLPELDAVVSNSQIRNEEYLQKLDPGVVVVYGQKDTLLDMVVFGIDVLVISPEDNSFYYFDSDRVLDDTDSELISRIVEDLDEYAQKERGKEHTRIQNALLEIGSEEGYLTKEEHSVSGLTVDAIWFKRENNEAKLTAEVETTGGWKKDILSMWETEPDIALLITTNHKTDKVAKDLARFSVIEYTPYKLIYVNLTTGNVYAYEDGQILGQFELGEKIDSDLDGTDDFDIKSL